jgi:type II secretory ATPase GspE/PulE/Tfp pilus assembly ATPase PilB-like protein
MIGEMRDSETAEVAVQAAMTGHLVFTTLHTNDAIGAIPRLIDLGVPEYLVAATVEAVLAQRLVRRVCDHCRTAYRPDPQHVALVSGKPVRTGLSSGTRFERGMGCSACRGTGFRGRLGLFELFVMTDAVKDAIVHRATRTDLKVLAANEGLVSLRTDGWQKVQAGLTTVEEVLRVAQD